MVYQAIQNGFIKRLNRLLSILNRHTNYLNGSRNFLVTKTFERFMKFPERFAKTFERLRKFTELFVKTFKLFMKLLIKIIFSRELSAVHCYLFENSTKRFEGFSVICYLHLSFEQYNEPFDKIHKHFELLSNWSGYVFCSCSTCSFVSAIWLCFKQPDNQSIQFKTRKHAGCVDLAKFAYVWQLCNATPVKWIWLHGQKSLLSWQQR